MGSGYVQCMNYAEGLHFSAFHSPISYSHIFPVILWIFLLNVAIFLNYLTNHDHYINLYVITPNYCSYTLRTYLCWHYLCVVAANCYTDVTHIGSAEVNGFQPYRASTKVNSSIQLLPIVDTHQNRELPEVT